nr:unnamed protein product [Digitaria exilis]
MGPNMSSAGSKQQRAAKRAYVTFLAGDGDYWKGVVGLAKGLRRVRAAYPLVVAVLPDVPEEHRRKLRAQGCVVREIQPDFLNLFFRDVYSSIPPVYNLVLAMLWRHPDKVGPLDEVKVVHYCAAGSKPWRYTGQEPNMDREDIKTLVARWWDIYNDDTLDHDVDQQLARQPLRQAMADSGATANYFPAPSAA